VSYTLGNNVENLTLTGSGNLNGTGNWEDNTITGNSGNNILKGGDGNDSLNGGDGNDSLSGGSGDDTLIGGSGNNTIVGGVGNDQLNLGSNYSDYSITYDSGTQAYTLTRAGETQVVTEVENFKFKDIDLTSTVLAGLIGPEVSGQKIYATAEADVITFNSNINNSTSNELWTGSGDDIVYTEGSKNYIFTGSGNDTIYVMTGDNQILGGSGNDVMKVYSGSTNARIDGSDGDDLFEIFAGADKTSILGGRGNDTIQISGNSTNNIVNAGDGVDTVRFEGKASDYTTSINGSGRRVYSKGGQVVATIMDMFIENVEFTEL
jgi:Ca2+-binding RTX toxin-like protein